jgi:hypothetical protein
VGMGLGISGLLLAGLGWEGWDERTTARNGTVDVRIGERTSRMWTAGPRGGMWPNID